MSTTPRNRLSHSFTAQTNLSTRFHPVSVCEPVAKMNTCYACDAPATGDEHVPPQCIFPKEGQYRKNLIKVPSCDIHNSKKSKNDEYLKFILTAVGGMSELAGSIFGDSVMRSFEHVPHLVDKFTPSLQLVQVGGFETGGFALDVVRFESSVASIVRGLLFHETGKKLASELRVAWAQMLTANYSTAPYLEVIRRAEQIPANYLGANPRVFQYAINNSNSGATWLCRLRFYEGLPICVTWN
jgi:hypothetical protein